MKPLTQDARAHLETLFHLLSTDSEVLELIAAPKYMELTARLALILRDAGSLMIDDQAARKAEALLEQAGASPVINDIQSHLPSTAVSLDGGLQWSGVNNDVRLSYREAEEDDDTCLDLVLIATHEGIVLDLIRQDDGSVARSAAIPLSDLVAMTQ